MFPAVVTAPDGKVQDGMLVILTGQAEDQPPMLVIYGEGGTGGIVKPFTAVKVEYASARPDPDVVSGWIVTDKDGYVWSYQKGSGCGCSSPLKNIGTPVPLDL